VDDARLAHPGQHRDRGTQRRGGRVHLDILDSLLAHRQRRNLLLVRRGFHLQSVDFSAAVDGGVGSLRLDVIALEPERRDLHVLGLHLCAEVRGGSLGLAELLGGGLDGLGSLLGFLRGDEGGAVHDDEVLGGGLLELLNLGSLLGDEGAGLLQARLERGELRGLLLGVGSLGVLQLLEPRVSFFELGRNGLERRRLLLLGGDERLLESLLERALGGAGKGRLLEGDLVRVRVRVRGLG